MTSTNRLQTIALGLLLVFPFIPGGSDVLPSVNQAAVFVIVAASLVMLTGWVGQISLAHAALVGIGAYAAGFAANVLGLPFPLNLPVAALAAAGAATMLGVVALRVRGLYLAVATLIFSWAASEFLFRQNWLTQHGSIEGVPIGSENSLLQFDLSGSRIAFFYVAWGIAIAVVYGLTNLRDSRTGRAFFAIRGSEMAAESLGMNVLRYKVLAFALSGALAGVAGSLIMTEARAVSPDTFGFNTSLFFLAIAVVGGLSSLPGAVAASVFFAALGELFFRYSVLGDYLELVSAILLAVVFLAYPGGLAALAVAATDRAQRTLRAARALPTTASERLAAMQEDEARRADEPRPDEEDVPRLTRAASEIKQRVLTRAARSVAARRLLEDATTEILDFELDVHEGSGQDVPTAPESEREAESELEPAAAAGAGAVSGQRTTEDVAPQTLAAGALPSVADGRPSRPLPDPARRHEREVLLEARGITVRFGGLVAVNDASLSVRRGEITGLIGPNGAGKTTLFNSIAGFNEPTAGEVLIRGRDVTSVPVFRRAQLGVARTFQRIQLFPQLTVFDNLLAATHLQNRTGFVQHIAGNRLALEAERAARLRVRKVVKLLDLEEVADRQVAGLPFGVLRMVEVARALVTGANVIMLDEPASGLDERETDRLTEVLRFVRDLGATLLLIEHDVRMVTSVSDYLYVLDQGTIIAEGPPAEIQSNEAVIAAYLGQADDDAPASSSTPPSDPAPPSDPSDPAPPSDDRVTVAVGAAGVVEEDNATSDVAEDGRVVL
ncbi:MAG TPA: branched-chain amino acid ABC transporter ATP-binding protein/permease [Nitriliruptorales bacterium]